VLVVLLERLKNLGWPTWITLALGAGATLLLLAPGYVRVDPTIDLAHEPIEAAAPDARADRMSRGSARPSERTQVASRGSESQRDERDAGLGSRAEPQPLALVTPNDPPADDDDMPVQDAGDSHALPGYLQADGLPGSGSSGPPGLDGEFDCIIEPFDVVEVGSALTAVVHSVSVERSDLVEAGQVIAELESAPEQAAVAVARARAAMDSDVAAHKARMELSRRKQKRADQLYQNDTLSADLRDEIITEAEVARAALREARESKALTELEYKEAIERLREHTIVSPISGVVVERLKSPGEVVKEETIVVVAQIDPLRVEVILPAAMIGAVEQGMRAEILPEIPEAGVQIASVTVVDRVIDGSSGTFGVRLELPNPDHALPSGLRCQVHFLPAD
jgi:RND family efflux transporter MFP subunit